MLAIRSRDRGEHEIYERIVQLTAVGPLSPKCTARTQVNLSHLSAPGERALEGSIQLINLLCDSGFQTSHPPA